MHTWIDEEIGEQNAPHPEQNGAIADRIDHMIVNYLPSGIRCCCLSIAEFLGSGEGASFSGLLGPVRLVFGPLLYGVLFTPFVFAVLQESAMNRVAVDAFTSTDELSSSAWLAAFLFVGAVVLYVLIAFTSLPPYEPRSARLLLLLSSVILVVWIQQILTFRYILLRPELSELKKNRGEKHKYQLCGRAYSSLNPRNMINYIHLTVILSEFCILASVCFHSSIPWQQYGAREEEYLLADWLQTVLPQALVGVFLDGSSTARLVVLLLFCFAYLMVAGWAIFTRKHPASFSMALVCDGLAGTLYTTVVGRLLLSAYNMDGDRHIGRVLAMLGFFGFSTTAVFVATMRGDAGDSRSKRQPDVRFLPKWLAVERILKGLVGIFAALLGNLKLNLEDVGFEEGLVNLSGSMGGGNLFIDSGIGSVTFVTRARTALLNVALAGQLITLSMLLMPWHGWLVVLLVVWLLAGFGLTGFALYKVFFAPISEHESEEMRRRRIKDIQNKMLRKGANGPAHRGCASVKVGIPY